MPEIKKPILKGFNPDPSILRVGDDYYIATSTFEWFPGVQIHHSRDLIHWRLLTRPLAAPASSTCWETPIPAAYGRLASVMMATGLPDLHGCEALWPHLGRGAAGASLRDFHNYMVTAKTIDGDWSDPVHMNSSGFDPSLFHDDDAANGSSICYGTIAPDRTVSPESWPRNIRATK